MDISEILFGAADLVEQRGWTQGDYSNKSGCVCSVAAVRMSAYAIGHPGSVPLRMAAGWDMQESVEAIDAVEDYLSVASLIGWNDAEERTQAEVVAALRGAAKAVAA